MNVIFDAVGTLIHPNPAVAEAYHRVGSQFGSAISQDEIDARFRAAFARQEAADRDAGPEDSLQRRPTDNPRERRRWQRIVQEVFCDVPDAGAGLFAALWDHFADGGNWSIYDDVSQAWSQLSARGIRLGIASNFDERLPAILSTLPPLDECPHVFFSADIGYPKPSPQFFAAVQDALGVPPHELVMTGDNLQNDFRGPRAAGWQAILLDRRGVHDSVSAIRGLDQVAKLLDCRQE